MEFEIIHELEQSLPSSLYVHEWRFAEQGRGRVYRAVTDIERWIPLAFLGPHVVLFIVLAGSALHGSIP